MKTTVRRTHGMGEDMKSTEEQIGDGLVPAPEKPDMASVTCGITRKVSDSVYWGDGTWDKIPYSVEVACTVTLHCFQSQAAIESTQERAHKIAWTASQDQLASSVVGHVTDIKERLYKHLF